MERRRVNVVGQGRRRALDGVRAVAAVGVVVYHCSVRMWGLDKSTLGAAFLENLGNFGVAVFFLLSGFLLFREFVTWILFDESRAALPRYFERRFLRIYPGYWVAVIGFMAIVGIDDFRGDALGIFTLFGRSFDERHVFLGLGVAWTLMIEVLFYIALPLIAGAIRFATRGSDDPLRRLRGVLVGLLVLLLSAHLWIALIVGPNPSDLRLRDNLPTYLGWFALGMVLATSVEWRRAGYRLPDWLEQLANRTWACWSLGFLAYLLIVEQRFVLENLGGQPPLSVTEFQYRVFFQGFAAFFFLLPVAIGDDSTAASRLLGRPTIAWVGLVSYGIYLWHPTVIHVVYGHVDVPNSYLGLAALVGMVLLIVMPIAWLSFRLVERPLLRLAR